MVHKDLSGHLALVTGATGGCGKAICLALVSLGCSIAVQYNAATDDASNLVRHTSTQNKASAQAFIADMGDYQNVMDYF